MNGTAFSPADILLPNGDNAEKWSVVACDQYTSEPEYWERVRAAVADAPSTLNLIFPEVYLGSADTPSRIERINATMNDYLRGSVLRALPESYLYVRRTLSPGKVRQGLVGKLDLESYDYAVGSQSPVRPTEGTVESRLPPRIRVRQDAPLETPHIMILIDDPDRTVIEPLAALCGSAAPVYDFPLMERGGQIAGWQVTGESLAQTNRALDALAAEIAARDACLAPGKGPLLFAVGDGNHSLATAKACYEQLKSTLTEAEWLAHPARWALVELVNVHDPALEFEPIHRVLFGVQPEQVLDALRQTYDIRENGEGQTFTALVGKKKLTLSVMNPPSQLAAGTLQRFIDGYLEAHGGEVDYIHGDDVVARLCARPDAIGFLLPAMEKSALFPTVQLDGALPRKTFSMGHAWEKRYYLECRAIR